MVYLAILANWGGGMPNRTVHLADCLRDMSTRTVDLADRSRASFNRTDYLADLQGRQLHRTGYLADCHLVLCLGTGSARYWYLTCKTAAYLDGHLFATYLYMAGTATR